MAEQLPAGVDPDNTLILDTTPGRIVIKLFEDVAPQHAERMKLLARDGFYNNVPFHRVIDGFMAQTGDGQYGNGTGGSKYPDLKAAFSQVPFKRGIVGMARKGNSNDSANSQFFIMFADGSFLNGKYTVIGDVVQGMNVVDKLKKGEPPASPDKIVHMQVAAQLNRLPPARAPCSVLSGLPCHPSFCSVFHLGPCFPQYLPPIGQDLRLTIVSTDDDDAANKPVNPAKAGSDVAKDSDDADKTAEAKPLDSIGEMYAALRACWT